MGIFDSTPAVESPEQGHEEMAAEPTQTETTEVEQQEYTEEVENVEEEVEEEVEETDEQDDEPSEQQEQGDLIAGKFKSQDDLVKAYKNLEREFHKSRQQEKQTPQVQTPQQQPPADDLNAVIQDYWETNPAGVLQHLVTTMVEQQVSQIKEQYINPLQEQRQTEVLANNIGELSNQYGQLMTEQGLGQLFGVVQEIAQELGNPDIAKNPTKRVLRLAASELWGEPSKAEMYQRGKEEAMQAREQSRRQKQAVNTKTAKKPKEPPKSEDDIIRERIMNAGYRSGGIFG